MRDYKRESAKFLMHIFDHDMTVCATIAVAEADSNTDVLLTALESVKEYINDLEKGLKDEKEDLSKLS